MDPRERWRHLAMSSRCLNISLLLDMVPCLQSSIMLTLWTQLFNTLQSIYLGWMPSLLGMFKSWTTPNTRNVGTSTNKTSSSSIQPLANWPTTRTASSLLRIWVMITQETSLASVRVGAKPSQTWPVRKSSMITWCSWMMNILTTTSVAILLKPCFKEHLQWGLTSGVTEIRLLTWSPPWWTSF